MSNRTVYFRGSRDQARAIVAGLGPILSGRAPDTLGIARGVFMSVGVAALSDIKADFVRKADGQTGEDGVKWEPLKPATIAARRVGARDKDYSLTAGAPEIKLREKLRTNAYRRFLKRLLLSLPKEEAQTRARRMAGQEATRRTGRTKVQTLGYRKVQILRDIGILLNSLSPGTLQNGHYTPPSGEGGDEQILNTIANGVIVGTNVPYGPVHQHGSTKKNIPARPFLPERVPDVWKDRWADAAVEALAEGAQIALGAAT